MSAVSNSNCTYVQYLEAEGKAAYKSEYYRGEIFAMTGGSPNHNSISINVAVAFRNLLRGGPCRPFNSDQRIRIDPIDLSTYPDVSIVCGELQLSPADKHAITNPKVIVEVLSKSTESYDRGKKFMFYREIDSLQEYVLISQSAALVEKFVRQADGKWLMTIFDGLDTNLQLSSVNIELTLAQVYEDVVFQPEE